MMQERVEAMRSRLLRMVAERLDDTGQLLLTDSERRSFQVRTRWIATHTGCPESEVVESLIAAGKSGLTDSAPGV